MTKLQPDIYQWLLQALEVEASVFHAGQYCGTWSASTAGMQRAAFHLVVHGRCWLHRPDTAASELQRGDAVFLLRDAPHALAPVPQLAPNAPLREGRMTPLSAAAVEDPSRVGLICGFFGFKLGISELIVRSLPEVIVVRARDPELLPLHSLFQLIVTELERDDGSSTAMIERLTGLMFLYLIRQHIARDESTVGLFAAARRSEFAGVLERVIRAPAKPWKLSELARLSGMSRASFFKHFTRTAGCSPRQLLLSLRMQAAGRLLERGQSIDQVAGEVGYHSSAAFARAFKRYSGQQPGAYRRGFACSDR